MHYKVGGREERVNRFLKSELNPNILLGWTIQKPLCSLGWEWCGGKRNNVPQYGSYEKKVLFGTNFLVCPCECNRVK